MMIANLPQQDSFLADAIPKNLAIAEEYRVLFLLAHLSPQQADRVEEILTLARQDKQLDSLITKIIYHEGHTQNLTDEDCMRSYKNQIAALREYQSTDFSGFTNTLFGNAKAADSDPSACTQEFLHQDIHQLAMALQVDASFNLDLVISSR